MIESKDSLICAAFLPVVLEPKTGQQKKKSRTFVIKLRYKSNRSKH